MKMKKASLLTLIILISTCLAVGLPVNSSSAPEYKRCYSKNFKIKLLSVEPHPEGSKYTFQVTSGTGKYHVWTWSLYSQAFRRYRVIHSSEKSYQFWKWGKLYFPKWYRPMQTRIVSFVLKHDPYHMPTMGGFTYRVTTRHSTYWGWIKI